MSTVNLIWSTMNTNNQYILGTVPTYDDDKITFLYCRNSKINAMYKSQTVSCNLQLIDIVNNLNSYLRDEKVL